MDAKKLKKYIIGNELLIKILDLLDYKHKDKGSYVSMKNKDGDNDSAVVIYKNSLNVINYTRGWESDLFELISKFEKISFSDSVKLISNVLKLTNKKLNIEIKKPNILDVLSEIEEACNIDDPLDIINESVFDEYQKRPNKIWYDEGIGLETQAEFQICYDEKSNSIVIPIRDEFGNLVGIKNRINTTEKVKQKYFYSHPVKKTRILYGLDKALPYIEKHKMCIVVESEKSVLKLWDKDIRCVVSISGSDISKYQKKMLEELGVKIILAFDKDIIMDSECDDDCSKCDVKCIRKQLTKFSKESEIYCIIDDDDLLEEKDSPIDKGIEIFKEIFKNRYKRG